MWEKILLIIRKIIRITRQPAHCRPHMTWAHTHPTSRRRLPTVQCSYYSLGTYTILYIGTCEVLSARQPGRSNHYPMSVSKFTFIKSSHLIRPFITSWILILSDIFSFPFHQVLLLTPGICNIIILKYFIILRIKRGKRIFCLTWRCLICNRRTDAVS